MRFLLSLLPMNCSSLLILHLLLLLFRVKGQSTLATPDESAQDTVSNFQPSLAFVIGVLCIMFAVTLLLLLYAKFCHGGAATRVDARPGLVRSASRVLSGIDKTVIESLPFFRFSSLKGAKEGLECAVCLSKFEDIEILRLLPQCKHAFHINCVDQWLEKHSSCPLCRRKVNANDPAVFTYSNSSRFLWNQSERQDDSNIELFIQREESRHGSSRFSIGGSFRKVEKGDIEADSLIRESDDDDDDNQKNLHKHNHRIIVSDVVFKNRWSNVSSSDLMFLNSEMLNDASSNRFSSLDSNDMQLTEAKPIQDEHIIKIKEEMEMKRLFESKFSTPASSIPSTSDLNMNSSQTSRIMDSTDRRSVSEIIGFSRFKNLSIRNTNRESSSNVKEEKMRQIWLPIAKRTVQWYANRQTRSQYGDNTTQNSPV